MRSNLLQQYPLELNLLSSLAYCDLAYNQITNLPKPICIPQLSCLVPNSALQILIVEGNPLPDELVKFISANLELPTNYKQLINGLREYYGLSPVTNDECFEKEEVQIESEILPIDYVRI